MADRVYESKRGLWAAMHTRLAPNLVWPEADVSANKGQSVCCLWHVCVSQIRPTNRPIGQQTGKPPVPVRCTACGRVAMCVTIYAGSIDAESTGCCGCAFLVVALALGCAQLLWCFRGSVYCVTHRQKPDAQGPLTRQSLPRRCWQLGDASGMWPQPPARNVPAV
jgi:hypothetical protein